MSRRANGSGTLYRRGGWYYGQLKVGDGVMRKALGTRDKREAGKRLDKLALGYDLSDEERLAALAVRLKPKTGRRSFDEAWTAYADAPENAAQSDLARANNRTMWDGFMRWLHGWDKPRSRCNCKGAYPGADCLDDVSERIASEFVAWMKANRSPETANKYIRVMKRIWTFNRAEENPWASFRRFKVEGIQKRALTEEEVDILIEKAEGEMKTLFTIGADTGMRMGDCQHFKWEMVCGDRIMRRTSKTSRLAGVPMTPRLKEALNGGRLKGYVMPTLAELPEWKISEMVQDHFVVCGFEEPTSIDGYKRKMGEVGFHSLRATFITRLGAAGVPLAVVREMVGHVSEEMSQRYFRINDAMAEKAIAALTQSHKARRRAR